MSDSESDDDQHIFDRIEPTNPICLGVDSEFCKLIFEIKHNLYADIIYNGDADTQEAQDMNLNKQYETRIGILYELLIYLFDNKGPLNDIPESTLQQFPNTIRDTLKELYKQCYQQSNNNNTTQIQHYRRLIKNMFSTYIYDMGTR